LANLGSRSRRYRAFLLGSAVGAAFAGLAPSAALAADADTGTLEELVVTAPKRSESLQGVPPSVGALTRGKLTAAGYSHLGNISRVAPGHAVDPGAGRGGQRMCQRPFEIVEDIEQRHGQLFDAGLPGLLPLLERAAAVVVELGQQAQIAILRRGGGGRWVCR